MLKPSPHSWYINMNLDDKDSQWLHKAILKNRLQPNVKDYPDYYASFNWMDAANSLDGLPLNKGINIAYEAVDRHVLHGRGDKIALRFIAKDNQHTDFTYLELKNRSNQFANVLTMLGIGQGDRVFTLLNRVPELYITALGTWKNRSIFCPLFSVFGPEPIQSRLSLGAGQVLVTTAELYRKKISQIRMALPYLQYILVIGEHEPIDDTLDYDALLSQTSIQYHIEPTDPESPAILHFTSGTTGKPKGAIHVHFAVLAHLMTGKIALDFHPDDRFWCTADPGWVTGTSYGIISPLVNGITSMVDEGEFDATRWFHVLEEQKVTVWYTAPTAIRMMMKSKDDLVRQYDLSSLRFIASVGEPLNPEAVFWGMKTFHLPIHDNWWQTETGGIIMANYACMDIKPGSMGRPMPGITVAVVHRQEEGTLQFEHSPDVVGELAIKTPWPSMFRTYLGDETRYHNAFVEGYYLSGDLVRCDRDGYFWFVGRADDIIKSAGHLIGPFEVESALMRHPAVAEAAVIGKPDPVIMEMVKAFVALKPGYQANEALRLEIMGFARKQLGVAIAPKEIAFLDNIPKTRSGKLMRRLLRARELGLPEGDTSTLESNV